MGNISNSRELINFLLNVLVGMAVQILPIATVILIILLIILWVKKEDAKLLFKKKVTKYLKFYGALWAIGLASLAIKLLLSNSGFFS